MEFRSEYSPTPEGNPDHTVLIHAKSEMQLSEAVRELGELAQHTLAQMKERLDIGYYNVIIGDDVSGRIPTLILKGVIDNIYTNKEFTKPTVRFFAGGKDSSRAPRTKQDAITQALSSMKKKLGSLHILVVTEFVTQGFGMAILNNAILNAGAQYDLAAMAYNASNQREIQTNISPSRIFYGKIDAKPPISYQEKLRTGLEKIPGRIHTQSKKRNHAHPPDRQQIQIAVNFTRREIDIAIRQLSEWYLQQKN